MVQENSQFDWHLCQNEADWQRARATDGAKKQDKARSAVQRILDRQWPLIGCVLLLLLLGAWKWYAIQTERNATAAALRQAVVSEERHLSPSTPQAVEEHSSVNPVVAVDSDLPTSALRIDQFEVHGDLALVRVIVREGATTGETTAYRETHLYQQTAQGWKRTLFAVDSELMGAWQTLETRHFVIRHRAVDAAAVAEVADRFDALYEELCRDVGVSAASTGKITIVLFTTSQPRDQALNLSERTIRIPSPTMLRIPTEWTNASVLHQALVYPLANLVLWEMQGQQSLEWQQTAFMWEPMMRALYLWELWESDGPLAVWRGDVVGWLYANTSSLDVYQKLPARHAELCHTYRTWKMFPLQTSIPLLCTESDPLAWYRLPQRLSHLSPMRAHYWDSELSTGWRASPSPTLDKVIGLETVLEYVVATYGRDRLPVLTHALGHHTQWHSLAPAVFGVSAAEFEDGWQDYLAERY